MTETINRRQMLKATSAGLLTLAAGHTLQPAVPAQIACDQCRHVPPSAPTLRLWRMESDLAEMDFWSAESAQAAMIEAARMHTSEAFANATHPVPLEPGFSGDCIRFRFLTIRYSTTPDGYSIKTLEPEHVLVSEVPPDEILEVFDEEDEVLRRRTASEWAADGPGFVASSDY